MRHLTLAARRAQRYLRRPPRPRTAAAPGEHCRRSPRPRRGRGAEQLDDQRRIARRLERPRPAAGVVGTDRAGGARRAGRGAPAHAARGAARPARSDLGMPLLAVDTAAAKERLETLAWVERASVARMLPDTVQVRLLERQPLALWQRDGRFEVIDRAGAVIEGAASERPQEYAHLRVLVGDDAPAGRGRSVRPPVHRAGAVRPRGRGDAGRRAPLERPPRQSGRGLAAGTERARRLAPAGGQGARRCAAGARDHRNRPALSARAAAPAAGSRGAAGSRHMSTSNVIQLPRPEPRARPSR